MTIKQIFEKVHDFQTIEAYRNYNVVEDYIYYSKLRSEYLGELHLAGNALVNDRERIDLNKEIDAYYVDKGGTYHYRPWKSYFRRIIKSVLSQTVPKIISPP